MYLTDAGLRGHSSSRWCTPAAECLSPCTVMDNSQQADNRLVFSSLPEAQGERTGRLDYVACWYAKAIDYLRGTNARVAFVSTNSITQGDQARALDPILRPAGVHIDFAHRTFKWQSEAAGGAAVHCVIIGMSATGRPGRVIFDYPTITGDPVPRQVNTINMYLIDSDQPAPVKRRVPFISSLPKMTKGSQATDNGQLIVDSVEDLEVLPAGTGHAQRTRKVVSVVRGRRPGRSDAVRDSKRKVRPCR